MLRRSSIFKNVLPVAAVAATMAWAGTANASLVVDEFGNALLGIDKKQATDDDGNPNLDLWVTKVYARFTDADDILLSISFAQMVSKDGSDFFQHSFGTDFAPGQNLVDAFPSLAFDSFITIGLQVVPSGGSDATSPDGDWSIGGFQGNKASGGWFAIPDSHQGDASEYPLNPDGTYWILIAQLTVNVAPLPAGVAGDLIVNWKENAAGGTLNNSGSFDNQVPSPGALALLGLAGLVGARRRRRR